MNCNIVFDYIHPHNGEYWFKCSECGARDWYGRGVAPVQTLPIKGCVNNQIKQLTTEQIKLLERAYSKGFADARRDIILAISETPKPSIEKILSQ